MIEIGHMSFLVMSELLLILSLTCGVLLFQGSRRRKRDYQAALKLVAAIQENAERREAFLRRRLEADYRYEGEELDQTLRNLLRSEKLFYQTLINAYLNREAKTFAQLNTNLEALTDIYEQLKIPTVDAGADGGNGFDRDVDLQYLRDKNERLSDELSETMDTMGQMLSEYSSMFEPSDDATVDETRPADSMAAVPDNSGETDSAELRTTPRPVSGDAEPQISNSNDDLPVESLEVTDDAVEGLLEDVARQVAGNVELPLDEDLSLDAAPVVDEQDLSGAFDDLEEIDIEADLSPPMEVGKSQTS